MPQKVNKPCTVEPQPRQVIERRLLARLREDKTVVAILANEQDLETLILALRTYGTVEAKEMAGDYTQLLNEAFRQ